MQVCGMMKGIMLDSRRRNWVIGGDGMSVDGPGRLRTVWRSEYIPLVKKGRPSLAAEKIFFPLADFYDDLWRAYGESSPRIDLETKFPVSEYRSERHDWTMRNVIAPHLIASHQFNALTQYSSVDEKPLVGRGHPLHIWSYQLKVLNQPEIEPYINRAVDRCRQHIPLAEESLRLVSEEALLMDDYLHLPLDAIEREVDKISSAMAAVAFELDTMKRERSIPPEERRRLAHYALLELQYPDSGIMR